MANPPEADILLLRREQHEYWTDEQLERLPDGIRDSTAHHILIEFKATESVSKETFIQTAAYEHFYKNSQKITDDEIQTFVNCAIQPQKANREQYGYNIRVQPGIYQSDNIILNQYLRQCQKIVVSGMRYDFPKLRYYWVSGNPLRAMNETNIKYQIGEGIVNHITLISLNELPDELHNAWVTCLASKKRKRLKAFNILRFSWLQIHYKAF